MGEYPSALDLNRLKKKYHLSDSAITTSGFSENDLQTIYKNYLLRMVDLEDLKNRFISTHIMSASGIHLHSYGGRVKNPEHLIEKIIRKRNNNFSKYRGMTPENYSKYITDLIGCRILLVYKKDWHEVHKYLTTVFPNDPEHYINPKEYATSFDRTDGSHPFIAEQPVAYVRLGDEDAGIYRVAKDLIVNSSGYYRSVHYIIRYEQYYVEVQVRSLFDEAWGEVDHDVLYPSFKSNDKLVAFSKLISRVAGMGNEISAYFKEEIPLGAQVGKDMLHDVPSVESDTFLPYQPCINPASPKGSSPQGGGGFTPENEILNIYRM